METTAKRLAEECGANERTLRRAINRGTVRCVRRTPRKIQIDEVEKGYLKANWSLIQRIQVAVTQEPSISLAVLHGSTARGNASTGSDIDILVSFEGELTFDQKADLAIRLEKKLHKRIDLAELKSVEVSSPLLLVNAITSGRVLIDRDDRWPSVVRRKSRYKRSAAEQVDREYSELVNMVENG